MFPLIRNISDVLPAIKGRPEFIVVVKPEGYTYIDYVYVDNDSFDDPVRLECRGLLFDTETGDIIRRPLEKFHNYGEKGTYDTLDWSEDHIVMDKRDGSMIAAFINDGKVRFGTRAGITEHSIKAEKHLTSRLAQELRVCIETGYTPIFEWTSPENQIVLKYSSDDIRLLAIRNRVTGEYVSWSDLQNWSFVFKIPIVDSFDIKLSQDYVFNYRQTVSGVEGYVVFFPSTGFHIKIKTDDYSKMHRAVSFMERENMILPVVLDELYDDILPALDDERQAKLKDYAAAVLHEVADYVEDIEMDVSWIKTEFDTRKDQALWIQGNTDKRLWPVYFRGLDGDEVRKHLNQCILKYPELLNTRWVL